MDVLRDNPWLAWVALALILAAVEAATVDFVFVMLAGGALAAALAAAVGLPFAAQVVIAVVVAVLLLVLVRPLVTRHFTVAPESRTIGAAGLVGRVGWMLQTVTRDRRPRQARRGDLVGSHSRRRCRASPAGRSGLFPSRGPP